MKCSLMNHFDRLIEEGRRHRGETKAKGLGIEGKRREKDLA